MGHMGEAARNRPTVVDLAFGRARIFDPVTGTRSPEPATRDLLDAVDAMTVLHDGRRLHLRQAWQQVFARWGLPVPDAGGGGGARPLIVGHPSTWGRRRAATLAEVGGGRAPVTLVPRAVLIARSHADVTVQRCAVVETTHVPAPPADPARPPARFWDVQILRRFPDGWGVERCGLIEGPAGGPAAPGLEIIDDTVEAVYVDGDDPDEVAEAIEMVTSHAVAGRVVDVDRDLVVRLGHRTGGHLDDAPSAGRPGGSETDDVPAADISWHGRRTLVAATAVAVVVVLVALAVGWWQRDEPAPDAAEVALGRVTLTVPGDWRAAGQDTPTDDTDDPTTSRTVFVSSDDGRRIIAVLTELRAGSTPESVAASLRNRIEQRGDDVVTEFSASTSYGGREVISYREAPASGSAIRWYVIVDDGLQVSIGCQPGIAAEPLDDECARAVGSVRVG
ncbi:type VII secretion-associated protein [Gordonia paraffinivorans]|uniref:type VII secretion-associated protein n=1 Tax=Gordonia paraffinivorans TaxID=175628 RepID=UPI003FCCCF7C